MLFALACEAAQQRLVVSYARRATGENRPRLPSVFFRELASQLEGRRVSAEEAPLLKRADVERIPGDAIGAPIPGGRYAQRPRVVSTAAGMAVSAAERDRTFLQADVTAAVATATFERAAPPFRRALEATRARWSPRYSEWDGALDGAALDAIAAMVPADRTFSPTSLENYAKCPQQFLLGELLRVRGIEEPERTFRIDDIRRGSLFHRIYERFHAEWNGPGPASLAPEAHGADARDRGGGVRRGGRARRDRISGDVGGRPDRGDRGLPAVAGGRARGPGHAGASARRLRGALRPAARRRADRIAVARSNRSRSISAGGRCGSPGGSTGSPGTSSRRHASG